MRTMRYIALGLTLACIASARATAEQAPIKQANAPLYEDAIRARIKHVVIIIQENRSVDNLFNGFPGADTVRIGERRIGPVNLEPVDLGFPADVDHQHRAWQVEYDNGRMDGFADVATTPKQPDEFPYAYVPERQVEPYWVMAKRYTLGDRMFQSNTGPSFPAHLYLIAGQAAFTSSNPDQLGTTKFAWGCDSPPDARVAQIGVDGNEIDPGIYPCLDFETLADVANANGVTWRYYAPGLNQLGNIWSAFDAIKHIRFSPRWENVVSPETRVINDAVIGDLPSITWVVPTVQNSDHPFPRAATKKDVGVKAGSYGPDWVASVVNAIGHGPFWNSTAIFIVWDDWGGWYDHVPPPRLDRMGLGPRVPLLVVSPWAKRHYVSHVQHEFGSILKFTEEVFNLPSLHTTDERSDDLRDCFDFTQAPDAFKPIPSFRQAAFFTDPNQPEIPPDDDY